MIPMVWSADSWTIWQTLLYLAVIKDVTPERAEIAETEPEFLELVDSMSRLMETEGDRGAEAIWRVRTAGTEVYWSTGQNLDVQIEMTVECSETAITAPKYLGSKGPMYALVFAKTDCGAEGVRRTCLFDKRTSVF